MPDWRPDGERDLLAAVVADLPDDLPKLVYADWLEERGDPRGPFLRRFVEAAGAMDPAAFPKPRKLPEEWLELVGFRLLEKCAAEGAGDLRKKVLKVARPALRMKTARAADRALPVGASKLGGLPDLPPGLPWPTARDCPAGYNDGAGKSDRLAGFVAQVNLAEVAHTQAARDLPPAGLLSVFCYQNGEDDNPDEIGVKCVFTPDPGALVRTEPPKPLTDGNGVMPARRLTFVETLDLPNATSGPWAKTLGPNPPRAHEKVFDHFRVLNFDNLLGYARATSGGDPTPSKASRHLILLRNAADCRLHIQIGRADLAARRFDRVKLVWVDFD